MLKSTVCRASVGSRCLTGQMRGPTDVHGSGTMVRWLRINRGVLPSTTTGGQEGGERRAKKVAFIYVNRVVAPSSASPPPPHFAPKLRGEPYFAPKVSPLSLRGEKPRVLRGEKSRSGDRFSAIASMTNHRGLRPCNR